MDIDDVLGAFELPTDRPLWETALLARLSDPAPVNAGFREQAEPVERQPMHTALILPFNRRAAA